MWAIPTGAGWLLKKKNQVESPSIWSRVTETGSDPPIGSDRDSGRDRYYALIVDSMTLLSPGVPLATRLPTKICRCRVPRYHTHMSHISRPIPAYSIHNIQKYMIDYNHSLFTIPLIPKRVTCFGSARI